MSESNESIKSHFSDSQKSSKSSKSPKSSKSSTSSKSPTSKLLAQIRRSQILDRNLEPPVLPIQLQHKRSHSGIQSIPSAGIIFNINCHSCLVVKGSTDNVTLDQITSLKQTPKIYTMFLKNIGEQTYANPEFNTTMHTNIIDYLNDDNYDYASLYNYLSPLYTPTSEICKSQHASKTCIQTSLLRYLPIYDNNKIIIDTDQPKIIEFERYFMFNKLTEQPTGEKTLLTNVFELFMPFTFFEHTAVSTEFSSNLFMSIVGNNWCIIPDLFTTIICELQIYFICIMYSEDGILPKLTEPDIRKVYDDLTIINTSSANLLKPMELNRKIFLSFFESLYPNNETGLNNSKYANVYMIITKLIVLNKSTNFVISLKDIANFNNLFKKGSPIIISKSCNIFCKDTMFENKKNPEYNLKEQKQYDAIMSAIHPQQYEHSQQIVTKRNILKEYLDQYELLPGELAIVQSPTVKSASKSAAKFRSKSTARARSKSTTRANSLPIKLMSNTNPANNKTNNKTKNKTKNKTIKRMNYLKNRKRLMNVKSI